MLNIRIQQNYRIDFKTVEKLHALKAETGTSINELVNDFLKLGIEAAAEIEIDKQLETPMEVEKTKKPDYTKVDMGTLKGASI